MSGRGGTRGYATSGRHRDPETGRWRWATAWEPVLVAGGGVAGTADPAMFMHNSLRPVDSRVRAAGVKRGNVLIGTEEQFNDDCDFSLQDGVLASAWYSQGTRLLDVSDARHPRQIAYFRVQATDPTTNPSSVVWDVRWHRGYAYVIDSEGGIEVPRLLRGGTGRSAEMATVRAPAAKPDPFAPVPVDGGRLNCPLFVDSPAAVAAKGTAG